MDYLKAITNTHPNAVSVTEIDSVYTALDKDGNSVTIDQSLVDAEALRIKTEHDSQEYARNRQAEYPALNDLIVALWENVVEERAASVIALEAKRQEIKTKYPK